MTVSKFGGFCMANPKSVLQSLAVVPEDCRVIVVSAPGRIGSGGEKITDLLAKSHGDHPVFGEVITHFRGLASELGLSSECREWLASEFAGVETGLSVSAFSSAFLMSRGEYWMGRLLGDLLSSDGWRFVDAADLFRFGLNGSLEVEETSHLIRRHCATGRWIIPGFYGATAAGEVCIGPRGASDTWAAIVCRALELRRCVFWKDVDGVFAADPKDSSVSTGDSPIAFMCPEDYLGRFSSDHGPIHAEAIAVLAKAGIPAMVRNFRRPESPGTVITRQATRMVA